MQSSCWDFGADDDYPILKNVGGVQRLTDYDADNDGLIEIANLAQLNAIRWDLDGDGAVTNDVNTADLDEADAYYDAFPGPVAGMGCPRGTTTTTPRPTRSPCAPAMSSRRTWTSTRFSL